MAIIEVTRRGILVGLESLQVSADWQARLEQHVGGGSPTVAPLAGLMGKHSLQGELDGDGFLLMPITGWIGPSVTLVGVVAGDALTVRAVVTWWTVSFFWGAPTILMFWNLPISFAIAGSLSFLLLGTAAVPRTRSFGFRLLRDALQLPPMTPSTAREEDEDGGDRTDLDPNEKQ